ncbi:MAG: 4-alpha-glucanotransferase, partial [Clostridia bacterium]|nr:4-alpha-glucanotransferase [Clostridia bacterium]
MRKSGILMPIFSLPSKYGIGTLGADAYKFIDFLKTAGQSYWQILPLNPTNYGDSPYQSFSSYAGNPYFVDIQTLIEEGLLTQAEAEAFDFGDNPERVDYGKLYENRLKLLKLAFSRFEISDDYISFCNENAFWLDDYSLFMAIKNIHNDACWNEWEKEYKHKNEEKIACARIELTEIIKFYK